jgi:hypothetical protein
MARNSPPRSPPPRNPPESGGHQAGGIGDADPGGGDVEGLPGLAAQHLGGVGGGAEGRLGHADDRDAVLGVDVRAQTWAARGIQVDVAVDDDQRQVLGGDDGLERGQFAAEELAGAVGRAWSHHRGPGPGDLVEGFVMGAHRGRPGL